MATPNKRGQTSKLLASVSSIKQIVRLINSLSNTRQTVSFGVEKRNGASIERERRDANQAAIQLLNTLIPGEPLTDAQRQTLAGYTDEGGVGGSEYEYYTALSQRSGDGKLMPLFSGRSKHMNPFKGRHFEPHIILWAARWYCKYGISYRELQEMLAERGVNVDHTTIYRWVQRYAPEMEKRLRWYWRQPSGFGSWHLHETYVKVNGRWAYLYRAVDSRGCTVDFYLSSRRNTKAAYRFMGKLLNNTKRWQIPRLINTDKAPTYGRALALLKREGKCPQHVQHRQIKYRNNIIECDHGKLKRIIKATQGFKSMKTAYATIKGIEVMRALRKGQAESFYYGHPQGEMRLVNRAFEM